MDRLDQIPWHELQHAYGSAEDVPDLLRALRTAPAGWRGEDSPLWQLFGNIWHQGTVYEATSYAVPFLIDLAADPQTPDRTGILGLLAAIADGSSYLDVHAPLLKHYEPYRSADPRQLEQEKQQELTWVAQAHAAVLAGFDIFLTIAGEPTDVRYAAANVLARLRSRADQVGPLLRQFAESESRSVFRAGLLLLLGELGDGSPESVRLLVEATRDPEALCRHAAAAALARLPLPRLPAQVREAMIEALLEDGLFERFEGLPWEASECLDRDALLQPFRVNGDDVTLRLIGRIEQSAMNYETVRDLLHLLFPMSPDYTPDRKYNELTPLQLRALRAMVTAIDRGKKIELISFPLWGLPDTRRELRNLAAGRPRAKVDESLPLLGRPEDPREPLVPRRLEPGQRLHHRYYGLGTVTSTETIGPEIRLQVLFDEEGETTLGVPADGWAPEPAPWPASGGFWSRVRRWWT